MTFSRSGTVWDAAGLSAGHRGVRRPWESAGHDAAEHLVSQVLAEPWISRVSAGQCTPQHRNQQTAQYRVDRVRAALGGEYGAQRALAAATGVVAATRPDPARVPARPDLLSSGDFPGRRARRGRSPGCG
jgi:hypothetical protein